MRLIKWLLDLLYPPKCIFCGKILSSSETDLCRKCRVALPETEKAIKRGEFFECCWSLYYYEETVAESIRRYKFHGMSHYSAAYGRLLAMLLLRVHAHFDVLTWAPISSKRIRERGYDQTRLLAEAVAKELGVPCVQLLQKIRHNPAQSGLKSADARKANVLGVYQAQHLQTFYGKRVLLLDDVITTGATLSECSRVLRTAGAASVLCATVAATRN